MRCRVRPPTAEPSLRVASSVVLFFERILIIADEYLVHLLYRQSQSVAGRLGDVLVVLVFLAVVVRVLP